MGKLSRNLLSALLLPLAKSQSDSNNFEVTSCNEEVVIDEVVIQRPALSLQILQSYVEIIYLVKKTASPWKMVTTREKFLEQIFKWNSMKKRTVS